MRDATFFTHPKADWQRRYEALRASFVDRLPAAAIADRFGYKTGYVRLLRHLFRTGKADVHEPPTAGKVARRRVSSEVRDKIRSWRESRLSAGEIAQLLADEGIEISVRTVERVLAEEGFKKLPRRTQLKVGLTVKGASVPAKGNRVLTRDRPVVLALQGERRRQRSFGRRSSVFGIGDRSVGHPSSVIRDRDR